MFENRAPITYSNRMSDLEQRSDGRRQCPDVVLAHDWITGFRGGERVLDAFCELYPKAPLYTLIHARGTASERIEDRKIHSSLLNYIPGAKTKYRMLLPILPRVVEGVTVRESCRVLLSSHHCVIKGLKKPPGAVHISYVHSPMRYMYDQYDNYFGPSASWPIRMGGKLFRHYLVGWDLASNGNVDFMIANSSFVRERIRKFYKRDAEVIHPFVDLKDFSEIKAQAPSKETYFVIVSAFAPNKRVDLAIEACNRLRIPLKIVGSGQLEGLLKSLAGPTIEFLGNRTRSEIVQLLASAQALIFPGVEDFGITPLESLAAGTPVVAFRAGGVLETLTDADTLFFNDPTVESLMGALRAFSRFNSNIDEARLTEFSRERFLAQIDQFVTSHI